MKTFLALLLTLLAGVASAAPRPDPIFHAGFEYNSTPCPTSIIAPDGVARTRKTAGAISYGVYQAQRQVQLLEWDSVWGFNNTTAPLPLPWPGVGGSAPVINGVRNTEYVALHFHTPKAPVSVVVQQKQPSYIAPPSNYDRQYLSTVISQQCGDFTLVHSPTAGCMRNNIPASDQPTAYIKFTANAPDSWCNLRPDTDYYVNMMFTHPDVICNGSPLKCLMATVSYVN